MDWLFALLMRKRAVTSFLARTRRVLTGLLGIRRPLNVPRFESLSRSGAGIRAVSESGSGIRYSGDMCPARVDAGSSTSWRAGLGFRVKGP